MTNSARTTRPNLLPHHEQMLLVDSGLPADIVEERGYFSAQTKAEIERLGFARNQCLAPALVIPIYGVSGKLVSYQIRPDTPRVFANGRVAKYEHPAKSTMVLDVPRRSQRHLGDPTIPLYITEGAKKADALAARDLCAIALSGVWNWRGSNERGGKALLPDWESVALNGRSVFIVFDSDVATKEQVANAMHRLKRLLESKKSKARVVYLPQTPSGEKQGIDDFLAAGGSISDLAPFIRENVEFPPRVDARPLIVVTNRDIPDLASDVWEAVKTRNAQGEVLFRRGSQLVGLGPRDSGGDQLVPVSENLLAHHVYRCAQICAVSREGDPYPTKIPNQLLSDIFVDPSPPLPECRAVVYAPVFAADGGLRTIAGYDPATRLYFDLSGLRDLSVKENPTVEDVRSAVAVLRDMMRDFPFAWDSSLAHAVALLVTPFVREMFGGPIPLFVFDAPAAGTGKTLLAKAIGLAITGSHPEMMSHVIGDEERKRITAVLQKGPEMAVIDNVKHRLDSPNLDALLTAESWSDRLLGTSSTVTLPNRTIWVATGNNVQLDGEVARRSLTIRLDAKVDRPFERTGFAHPDFLEWVMASRPVLLRAVLTIVRWWISRGRPDFDGVPLGSFESWSRVVGGILQCAGIQGFLRDRDEVFAQSDDETQEWREFVAAWYDDFGTSSVQARDLAFLVDQAELLPRVQEQLRGEPTLARLSLRLGKALSSQRDRRVGNLYIRVLGRDGHTKATRYALEPADDADAPYESSAPPPHAHRADSSSIAEDAEDAEDVFNAHAGESANTETTQDHQRNEDRPPQPPQPPQPSSNQAFQPADVGVPATLFVRNAPPHESGKCSSCGIGMTKDRYGSLCSYCHRSGRGQ